VFDSDGSYSLCTRILNIAHLIDSWYTILAATKFTRSDDHDVITISIRGSAGPRISIRGLVGLRLAFRGSVGPWISV